LASQKSRSQKFRPRGGGKRLFLQKIGPGEKRKSEDTDLHNEHKEGQSSVSNERGGAPSTKHLIGENRAATKKKKRSLGKRETERRNATSFRNGSVGGENRT